MQSIEFPKFKDYIDQKVNYIQPKFDGHLVKIYKEQIGEYIETSVFTKNDKDITKKICNIKHLHDMLICIPPNSILFGELHCPGIKATSIPTLLNNTDERLQISIFAAPILNRLNFQNEDLISIMNKVTFYNIPVINTKITLLQNIRKNTIERLLKEAEEQKLEGWVLKENHMSGWYKLKPVKTIDCFVISSSQSFSSSHYGGLQSISVACYKKDKNDKLRIHLLGNVGSGFTKEFRLSFEGVSRFALLDKICEVAYDSIAANGKLRFPRFIRWRDDKNKKDCVLEEN